MEANEKSRESRVTEAQDPPAFEAESNAEWFASERKITVIMFTDIVGYSLLANAEMAKVLEEHRRLLRPAFTRYGGSEVKTIGDAFLVVFASAVAAVRCAIEIQRLMLRQNLNGTTRKIQVRIGINIGEVIQAGNDVYGNAVNLASRIVSYAEPGGILISKQVYDFVWNEVDVQISRAGPVELKYVKVSTEVYRVVPPWQSMGRPLGERGDGPSISSLIPNLFKLYRPTADGNSPVVYAGSVLNNSETHILPITKGLRPRRDKRTGRVLYAALGGYSFLERYVRTKSKDYEDLLRAPIKEIAVWIGSVGFDSPISDLLSTFDATKFGVARVKSRAMHTLATLADLVEVMRNHSLISDMHVEEVGSQPAVVSSDASIKEAVEAMIGLRVRRLFLRDRPSEFISSRSVIEFMFSPDQLRAAGKRPEEWCAAKVSMLRTRNARAVAPDASLNEASRIIGDEPDDCLVSEGRLIISRWDLLMKPWKSGHLSPLGS